MKEIKLSEVQVWFDQLLKLWSVTFHDSEGCQIGTFHDLSDQYSTQHFQYKKEAEEFARSYHKLAKLSFYKRDGEHDYSVACISKEQLLKRWLHECPVDFRIINEVASSGVTTMQISFSH
jgi:hypothetical protein